MGAAASALLTAVGCGTNFRSAKTALDPKSPVTVTVWNYYNGDQLAAFNRLVEKFNTTVGGELGVVVLSVSQGDINTLANELLDSVAGKAGAQETPTLAAVYAETGYILQQQGALSAMDPYFTDEELSAYIPGFLSEGRFDEGNDLMLFPFCKSTEIFTANATDWAAFATATGITLESIQTVEDLTAAAAAYYNWTDSLTPDVAEDGKALYGRDSIANYIYLGCRQLGHTLFTVDNGNLTVDMDRDTFRTLWDNYYIPYINGYFSSYGRFRSDDAKTGKILALTASSSGMCYLPTQVTAEDDEIHDITLYSRAPLPFANAVTDSVVQQGAGFCLLKGSAGEQEGAAAFLKWITQPEQNLSFSLMSGYSPVTLEANSKEAIEAAYHGDMSTQKGQLILNTLLLSADLFSSQDTYNTRPFSGSKDVRSLLEDTMQKIAASDRAAVVKKLQAGISRRDAVAPYASDAYFDAWFQSLQAQVLELTQP